MTSALTLPSGGLLASSRSETPTDYHRLADFVIGKPGSMRITEALIDRKPLIIIQSRGMRPLQRGNENLI